MSAETVETRRIALISDVHANLPAFEAVLADIERAGADAVWCLGDLVGYGGQPNECVALAAESLDLCLAGNHDLVALDRLDVAAFSPNAAIAAEWTRSQLGPDARAYLEGLAPAAVAGDVGLYHASPRDPVWEYVLSAMAADDCIDRMEPRVGAIGHTHVALAFWRRADGPTAGSRLESDAELDLAADRWLVNPGSVGQPRDGDPRAAWLLLDLGSWSASWRRCEYTIGRAADAIRAAGLPKQLSDRLYYGR